MNRQSNNSVPVCITLFCTFFYHHCTTTTGKCQTSSFMVEVNKWWRNFLSPHQGRSGPRKNVPFLWIGSLVPLIEVINTKIMCTFSETKFWGEVVSIYILHGVMAQQNFDSFFKCNIQFIKTYKIFLSLINISAVNTLGRWHFEIWRDILFLGN